MPQQIQINYPEFYNNDPKIISSIIKCIKKVKCEDKIRFVNIDHWVRYKKYNYKKIRFHSKEYGIASNGTLIYYDAIVLHPFKESYLRINFAVNRYLEKYITNANEKIQYDKSHIYASSEYFGDVFYPFLIFKK